MHLIFYKIMSRKVTNHNLDIYNVKFQSVFAPGITYEGNTHMKSFLID